ncbi:MAG: PBP1A family penicillin-binding protein [Gemmatimonadaceae bacterium]
MAKASRRKPSPSWWARRPRWLRIVILSTAFLGTFSLGLLWTSWAFMCRGGSCPSIDQLDVFTPHQTSKLYGADGRFVAEIGLERRTLVKLGDIPKILQNAFVITEDKRFYGHHGIDFYRVAGAVIHNLGSGGYGQGFSTITMQLARNVFSDQLSREKTITRKLREAKIARQIESRYSKDKILELYLNQINLGAGAYGVETASQRYFGKSVRDLNIAEAATLAALPKAPERYNPRKSPERAVQRRNTIIELMRRQGAISDADARLAKAYPLKLADKTESGDLAPYFVEWVRRQLETQFGARIYTDGLKVFTTLDVDMQLVAERAMNRQMHAIEAGKYGAWKHMTFDEFNAKGPATEAEQGTNTPYLQGAFVAMDPRTGAVRALIGGRDFDDSKFNRATQALRQPGSTFKPIVYSAAIHAGKSPSYIIDDAPFTLPNVGGGGRDWTPQNYDLKFEGPMPLRRALYMSRNIPAIKIGMEIGEASVIETAHRFGLTTPIPTGPAINIGAADVIPMELIAGYSAFATLGARATPTAIIRVENAKGDVLWEPPSARYEVMAKEEAWIMVSMLKDVVQRGTAASVYGSGFHVPAGGKTGTTNDGTDVWFIGFTPDLVAGMWMGFDKPQTIMRGAQGGRLVAPAWTAFMSEVYQRRATPADWPRPESIVVREIDKNDGMLRNPYCPADVVQTEYYLPGTEPTQECTLHNEQNTLFPNTSVDTSRGRRDTARVPNPFKIP